MNALTIFLGLCLAAVGACSGEVVDDLRALEMNPGPAVCAKLVCRFPPLDQCKVRPAGCER